MRYLITALLVQLLMFQSLARPLYKLPKGDRTQVNGQTHQIYTFEEMKTILKMDVDLEFYETVKIPKIKQELDETKLIIEEKDKIVKSKDAQLTLMTQDRDRLSTKWAQENKLRHECENKPKFGNWIAWGITATVSVVAITLGVILIVKESK